MSFSKVSTKDLLKMKNKADDIYTNEGGDTGFTDNEYDTITKELKKRNVPTSVGAPVRDDQGNRVDLPLWLGSIDTFKENESVEIKRWVSKMPKDTKFYAEPKLDGVSALFSVRQNKLYTRGNGVIGGDISFAIPHINFCKITSQQPDFMYGNMFIRGELVIKKSVYESKYKDHASLSRNMVAGVINRKKVTEELSDIDFVAYEIIDVHSTTQISHLAQLSSFQEFSLNHVGVKELQDTDISTMSVALYDMRNESEYDIDGIVIHTSNPYQRNTSKNPSYMIAFKIDTDYKTTVIRVEWGTSRWGMLKPVAILEPVQMPGAVCRRATCHCAGFLRTKGIGPGAEITLIRSGEVIPKIVNVQKPAAPQYPDVNHVWNETGSNILVVGYSPDQELRKITYIFIKLKVKFVSESTVKKMFDSGLDTIYKILDSTREDLLKIKTFKQKTVDRIMNIHQKLSESSQTTLAVAFGIFGEGFSDSKVNLLLTSIPEILETDGNYLDRIKVITGFSEKSATKVTSILQSIHDVWRNIKRYISSSPRLGDISQPPPSSSKAPPSSSKAKALPKVNTSKLECKDSSCNNAFFTGKSFVFSGFRDTLLEDTIKSKGGNVANGVTKTTSMLITKDDKETVKTKRAEVLGIEKVYYDTVISML
jgi:DNA ligase (NAD+)